MVRVKARGLDMVDYDKVYAIATGAMLFLKNNGRWEPDWEHYLAEEVLKAIYGPEVWKWVAKVMR